VSTSAVHRFVTGAVDIGHLTGWLFAERQIVCCSSAKWCVDKNHVIKQKDFTQKVATTESSKFRTNFQSTNKLQPIKMCYVDLLYSFVHFLDQHVPKTFKSFV
jgi:hypothetical protein